MIAGIGNIYSDEILYRARINPSAPANGLSIREWERLAFEIADCLRYFIDKNSISQEDYLKTKRSGLPQYSIFASVRSHRRTLPELRKYIVSCRYRRQEQRVLSCLSKYEE